MQLRKPSTARVLASHVKKVSKLKNRPERVIFYVVFVLVVIVCILDLVERRGRVEPPHRVESNVDGTTTPAAKAATPAAKKHSRSGSAASKQPIIEEGTLAKDVEAKDPKLEVFIQKIRNALGPYTKLYTEKVPVAQLAHNSETCGESWSSMNEDWALSPCADCPYFETLLEARKHCSNQGTACGGVTQVLDARFQPRPWGSGLLRSRGERSWKKVPDYCRAKDTPAKSTAKKVWEAFHDVVDAALDDDDLRLDKKLYNVREDGSIFISIASYRDKTCGETLQKAFQRAKYPQKLSAGIVQQNCMHPTKCMTGTGWGNTRQWVRSDGPDPDCVEGFCQSEFGKPHCDEGRVRILRLDEIDSLGPFFTRFANAKLWRGENFYLQIDAHTDFRQDWDVSMVAQMRATKSYPKTVISNYPPSGTPKDDNPWPAPSHPTTPENWGPPSALCSCTFETAGVSHYTVRLGHTSRHYRADLSRPRRSLFVAAGFFIAHGSIVDTVGFDPFLPFLFMGEEIALSIRFYTNGYDIYAPSVEVLRHEYVRKEAPKFWESVGQVYSRPNLHNELTDLIVQRVQNLVRFPEADSPDKIEPQTLLTRLDKYGLGAERTAEQFLELAGMDLVRKQQTTPQWCIKGEDAPDEKQAHVKAIDADLLH